MEDYKEIIFIVLTLVVSIISSIGKKKKKAARKAQASRPVAPDTDLPTDEQPKTGKWEEIQEWVARELDDEEEDEVDEEEAEDDFIPMAPTPMKAEPQRETSETYTPMKAEPQRETTETYTPMKAEPLRDTSEAYVPMPAEPVYAAPSAQLTICPAGCTGETSSEEPIGEIGQTETDSAADTPLVSADDLADPDELRRAVLMSEILTPKYQR